MHKQILQIEYNQLRNSTVGYLHNTFIELNTGLPIEQIQMALEAVWPSGKAALTTYPELFLGRT